MFIFGSQEPKTPILGLTVSPACILGGSLGTNGGQPVPLSQGWVNPPQTFSIMIWKGISLAQGKHEARGQKSGEGASRGNSYLHLEGQRSSLTWAFPFPGLPVVEGQDPE